MTETENKKSALGHLEPRAVFSFFEEICAVPHGSTHCAAIADHLVAFAKERGLRVRRDEADNVVIFKDGTAGYEDKPPVILQGHTDMVCVAEDGVSIDFETQGITPVESAGIVTAKGTSLGGDDGIAVAMCMALLDADDTPHPPLEVVLTSDEEIGMLGAAAFDTSDLSGKTMLNLDSEEEGHLLAGCAGGATVTIRLHEKESEEKPACGGTVRIAGLTGGHSGMEIIRGRANAILLLARALEAIEKEAARAGCRLCIGNMTGGGKDNAIPVAASASYAIVGEAAGAETLREKIDEVAKQLQQMFSSEFAYTDPALRCEVQQNAEDGKEGTYLDPASSKRVIQMIRMLPNGVMRMCDGSLEAVQTSLNFGILKMEGTDVEVSALVRSSVESEKKEVMGRLSHIAEVLGGEISVNGDYPAWEKIPDSPLRDLMCRIYREQYKEDPVVEVIHAGVGCGLFAAKIPGLDTVSFGPDMKDIHSPKESMDVASVQRTWRYVLEILKKI